MCLTCNDTHLYAGTACPDCIFCSVCGLAEPMEGYSECGPCFQAFLQANPAELAEFQRMAEIQRGREG